MKETEKRLAFNLALYSKGSKGRIVDDLASFAIEQRRAGLEERVNSLTISLGDFEELRNGLSWERKTYWAENAAYFKILNWVRENDEGFLLWISPANEMYSESRFVVYQIGFLSNGQKVIHCWSICEENTAEECLEIVNKFQKTEMFDDPEVLRCNVFSFDPPEGIFWTQFLSRFFGDSKIWQAIEVGKSGELKRQALEAAKVVFEENQDQIFTSQTRREQIWVGAKMEGAMEGRLGIRIQPVGGCGVSNRALLAESGASLKVNTIEGKDGRVIRYMCPICKVWVKPGGICPKAGCNWIAPS